MRASNKSDFEQLALERLQDAEVLLANGRNDAAYYLAGYAVECALKACIAKMTSQYDFPRKDGRDFWVHDLARLVNLTDLKDALEEEEVRDKDFALRWAVVQKWSEGSRYESGERDAAGLLHAITDPEHGVLKWIRRYW